MKCIKCRTNEQQKGSNYCSGCLIEMQSAPKAHVTRKKTVKKAAKKAAKKR